MKNLLVIAGLISILGAVGCGEEDWAGKDCPKNLDELANKEAERVSKLPPDKQYDECLNSMAKFKKYNGCKLRKGQASNFKDADGNYSYKKLKKAKLCDQLR